MRGSEQVIRSALLHVKWDTVTSSPPRSLLSPEEKLYKGSRQRAVGLVFEWSSSVSFPIYKYPSSSSFSYFHKLSISVLGSLLEHTSLYFALLISHFSSLISFIFFVIYDQSRENKEMYSKLTPPVHPYQCLEYRSALSRPLALSLSLSSAGYACVGVDKVLLWRPFATTDATRRDLYMTF